MLKPFEFYQYIRGTPSFYLQLTGTVPSIFRKMKFIVLACLLGHFISLSTTLDLEYDCPEPEEIFPCYCEDEDGDPTVYCNHMTKPEQIYEGVKGLKGYRIYRISFFRNWLLEPVKADAFNGLTIEKLFFENSTISLTAPQFQGVNRLNSIQLRAIYNETNPIVPLELDHLKNLREIVFEKNKITILPNNWLKSAPDSLRSVSIEGNTIVSMEDEVFAKITKLSFLVLESNRLVSLQRSMFPNPANDLRSINLNNNRIKYLPFDLFSDMPNLRSLEMEGNRLATLEESIWSGAMSQLTKLNILNNPLVCDSSLKWLYATKQKIPVIFEGRCEEPEKLRKKSLLLLKESDLS